MKISHVFLSLFFFLFISLNDTNACSIFCAAKNGKVLAAGNEDWSDSNTQMWVSERREGRYGMVNFGHMDYQVQAAINEHGLFFDFAAIPKAKGKGLEGKVKLNTNLFTEILSTCKTIDEAMVLLHSYEYPSAWNQVLMADAYGESVIVNQDTILRSTLDHQIATNFNACKLEMGNYNCRRYEIIENGITNSDDISIPLFRKLLSNSHQEGNYPTQYSYIFDLKKGNMYLYSFHNYENVVVLNVVDEVNKGYKMKDFKSMFPPTFEEEYFRLTSRDTLTQDILNTIKAHGVDAGLTKYKEAVAMNGDAASYPFVLLSVGGALVHQAWFEDNKGQTFDYWFHPENVLQWINKDKEKLKEILKVYDYLEATIPPENPKQYIGTYELKGLLFYLLDEKAKSKEYFEKTIEVAPEETSNYQRARVFLDEYFKA